MKSTYALLAAFFYMVIIAAGCASKAPQTPEEIMAERKRQLNMVTRIYEGKTPEEILLATDQVFRLADEDYTIVHSETALQAQRDWMLYMVLAASFGTDTWTIETFSVENGTKVIARHSESSQGVYGTPTGSGGASATTVPALKNTTLRPAIYELFFARLEYLLALRQDWVTCDAANFTDGSLDPFCFLANDTVPE